jgi:hypothetical protein
MAYIRKKLDGSVPVGELYERSRALDARIAEVGGARQREEQWVKDQIFSDPATRSMNYAQREAAYLRARRRHMAEFDFDAELARLWQERSELSKAIQRHPDSGMSIRVSLTQGEALRLHDAYRRDMPDETEVDMEGFLAAIVRGWMKERGI